MTMGQGGERAALEVETIDCFGLEAPLDVPFGFSQAWVRRRRAVLVRVETRDGIEGWGEIYCQVPPPVLVTLVAELLGPLVLGTDPWDREVTWQRLDNATLDAGQGGLVIGALSGLDVALWDIAAKDAGQPVCRLLGGEARSSIRAYATGLYRQPGEDWFEAMAAEARQYVAEGYTTLKMKVGFGLETDVAAVRAVRAAIGPEITLGIDANHAYRAREAVALGRHLADQEIAWFEEPVSPRDLDGYRQVRQQQPIPVAGGEIASTRFSFQQLIDAGAVDILQPDLGWAGGLSEGKAIAALARTHHLACWAHVWGTPVAQATALHFLGSLPETSALADVAPPLLEWDRTPNPLRDELSPDPPRAHGGEVVVPGAAGLGVEIDREALRRFQTVHRRVSIGGE